jgi:methylenetetrahydrofolate reductase (NADPH)
MRFELNADQRAGLRRVLEHAKFELIPLKNVLDQARYLPSGATVSVTASPVKTIEDTWDLAASLQQMGFTAVPHLSARMTRDLAHLERLLKRLDDLDIHEIFLVGGDAQDPGEFYDALSILRAMDKIGHSVTNIGVTSYPDGHSVISDEKLVQALHDKQPYASSMTTQMCFDHEKIGHWLKDTRNDGIILPAVFGIPGVADRLKLITISARIGVGQSARFLSKNSSLVSKFIKPGGYSPAELLEPMANMFMSDAANVAGLHIYTFNQCDTTEEWRQQYLADLR